MSWSGERARRLSVRVFAEKGRICHLCGLPGATVVDHYIPVHRGGAAYDMANLWPAHYRCNAMKGDKILPHYWDRPHSETVRQVVKITVD